MMNRKNLLLTMIHARSAAVVTGELSRDYWGWFDLSRAVLAGANLRGATLTHANLAGANLTHVDLDFSSWPLWCGSIGVKVDARIARQLMYHACAVDCDDPEFQAARAAVAVFADKFHRVTSGKCKPVGRTQ